MKIVEANSKLVQEQAVEGLFHCKLTHEIKATAAVFDYTGPKFKQDMWDEVLAFFKWSNNEHHSEAQVRLFVHPVHGWKAWAFPQEGGTGMTTRELDTPEAREQRMQFNDEWFLYGTVHHHCNSSAFQSGVDTHNEESQEGIHITVGNMDRDQHSIHSRFYYKGCKFEPDLSIFWPIDDSTLRAIEQFKGFLSAEVNLSAIASKRMGETCPADTQFPEQWKSNYILKPKFEPKVTYHHGGATYTDEDRGYRGFPSRCARKLRDRFKKSALVPGDGDDALLEAFKILEDVNIAIILRQCAEDFCNVQDLIAKFEEQVLAEELEAEKAKNPTQQLSVESMSIQEEQAWMMGV